MRQEGWKRTGRRDNKREHAHRTITSHGGLGRKINSGWMAEGRWQRALKDRKAWDKIGTVCCAFLQCKFLNSTPSVKLETNDVVWIIKEMEAAPKMGPTVDCMSECAMLTVQAGK